MTTAETNYGASDEVATYLLGALECTQEMEQSGEDAKLVKELRKHLEAAMNVAHQVREAAQDRFTATLEF